MIKRVLLVCTGNICRSPMAEAMLRKLGAGRGLEIGSAGTAAMKGWPADADAQAIMQEHGYDLSAHVARQAGLALLTASDLILTLDQSHNDWINKRYPQFRGRVHKLMKWHKNKDVEDPYGRPRPAFERVYADLETGIADWLKRLA